MTGSTPISTGATVLGANTVSQAQTQTPVAQKSESTWAIWKNSFFGKDAGFFKRTVCTIAAAVSYLPARVYSYFTGKGLLGRTVTQPQAPVQKQMPSANGQAPAQTKTAPASVSQTPASPVSSEVESLKAQLAATVEEQKHKLESQKSEFMTQIIEKDRYAQWLDKLLVKEQVELEKTKAKCAEHKKSEEVARDTLVKYVSLCAGNERQIKELKAKVSKLTNDCQNLMLRNPETKAVVDRLKKDHKDEIAHLVAELRAARDGSGRLSPTQIVPLGLETGDQYEPLRELDAEYNRPQVRPVASQEGVVEVVTAEEVSYFFQRRRDEEQATSQDRLSEAAEDVSQSSLPRDYVPLSQIVVVK